MFLYNHLALFTLNSELTASSPLGETDLNSQLESHIFSPLTGLHISETYDLGFILNVKEITVNFKYLSCLPNEKCLPERRVGWPTSEVLSNFFPAFLANLLRKVCSFYYIAVSLHFIFWHLLWRKKWLRRPI